MSRVKEYKELRDIGLSPRDAYILSSSDPVKTSERLKETEANTKNK